MSSIQDELPLYLKLRDDIIARQVDGGLRIHNRSGGFTIKMDAPSTDVQDSVLELKRGVFKDAFLQSEDVGASQTQLRNQLVSVLTDRRFLLPIPNAWGSTGPADWTFASQRLYLLHFSDSPEVGWRAIQESKVGLAGPPSLVKWFALSLARNGFARIVIGADDEATRRYLAAELDSVSRLCKFEFVSELALSYETGDAFIVADLSDDSQRPTTAAHGALSENMSAMIPVWRYQNEVVIGPIPSPNLPQSATLAEVRHRFAANHRVDTRDGGYPEQDRLRAITGTSLAMIGNQASLELFRLLGRCTVVSPSRTVLIQDLASLAQREVEVGASFLPVSPTPFEMSQIPSSLHGSITEGAVDPPLSVDECVHQLELVGPLFDESVGIMQRFSDEAYEQLPLKVSTVDMGVGDGDFVQTLGASADTLAHARLEAFTRALEFRFSEPHSHIPDCSGNNDSCWSYGVGSTAVRALLRAVRHADAVRTGSDIINGEATVCRLGPDQGPDEEIDRYLTDSARILDVRFERYLAPSLDGARFHTAFVASGMSSGRSCGLSDRFVCAYSDASPELAIRGAMEYFVASCQVGQGSYRDEIGRDYFPPDADASALLSMLHDLSSDYVGANLPPAVGFRADGRIAETVTPPGLTELGLVAVRVPRFVR